MFLVDCFLCLFVVDCWVEEIWLGEEATTASGSNVWCVLGATIAGTAVCCGWESPSMSCLSLVAFCSEYLIELQVVHWRYACRSSRLWVSYVLTPLSLLCPHAFESPMSSRLWISYVLFSPLLAAHLPLIDTALFLLWPSMNDSFWSLQYQQQHIARSSFWQWCCAQEVWRCTIN